MSIIKGQNVKWICLGVLPISALFSVFLVHPTKSQVNEDWAPFTAYYTETSSNVLTGKTLQLPLLYVALRSDGARSSGNLDLRVGYRKIRNRQEKKEVTVSDFLRLKSTLDYSYIPINSAHRPITSDCRPAAGSGAVLLGSEMIGNQEAYHFQLNTVLSDRTKREFNQWLVPNLGCWEIQQITRKYNAEGVLDGLFEKKITRIALGDPDVSLFAVPNEYAEVRSSELEMALHQQKVADRDGIANAAKDEIPLCILQRWNQADDHYDAVANKRWQPASPVKR